MLTELPLAQLAFIALVVCVGAFSQGLLGFGFPIIVTPILAMLFSLKLAVFVQLLPIVVVCSLAMLRGGNLRESLGRFWFMPVAMGIGSAVGAQIFFRIDPKPLLLLLAALVFLYLNLERLGHRFPVVEAHPKPFAAGFAFAAGVTESTVNIAAPVILIFFLSAAIPPLAMIQTMNMCFFTGKSVQAVSWMNMSGLSAREWLATLPYVALSIAAFFVGERIRGRADTATYKRWLRAFLWLVFVLLIAHAVLKA